MKKAIIILSLIIGHSVFSQGRKIVLSSNNGSPEFFAGSLPINNNSNFSKLKIQIFGGNYHNSNLGENSYYISTRDGLKINQEVHGGTYSKYILKVYDNGNGYDFVLKINGDWPSIYVRSWLIDGNGVLNENIISDYDTTGKVDITNQAQINPIFVTDNIGNIGIGTTDTKGFKLGVQGKIAAEEVKVALYTNWADFVFKSNYKLPSLKEVEQHIKEKGHLKDIPSAEDVKENGIFLGEMDSKLLQKIEELTLYTINQEKRLESLELKNEELVVLVKKLIDKKIEE